MFRIVKLTCVFFFYDGLEIDVPIMVETINNACTYKYNI